MNNVHTLLTPKPADSDHHGLDLIAAVHLSCGSEAH